MLSHRQCHFQRSSISRNAGAASISIRQGSHLHRIARCHRKLPVRCGSLAKQAEHIQATGLESRAVGCFLGTLCGDALGTPISGTPGFRVLQYFPAGLTSFFPFGLGHTPGAYSGVSRSFLALASGIAAEGRLNPDVTSESYTAMYDPQRQYLPYDSLIFSVLALSKVFKELKAAIVATLDASGHDTSRLDQQVFLYWWREYVDINCPDAAGDAAMALVDNPFDYLGIDRVDVKTPDEKYRRYKRRLATRTQAPDPLGLQRFEALYHADPEWVKETTMAYAVGVATFYTELYGGMVQARNFVRHELRATPEDIPAVASLWRSFATFVKLPPDDREMPSWWFKPLTSRAVDPATQNTAIVEELLGTDYRELPAALAERLHAYAYKYTSVTRMPGGSDDSGGASRIAPLALAYRSAPLPELEEAVRQALSCSHTGEVAVDAALVHAAAVQWLCQHQGSDASPQQLLTHLEKAAKTEGLREKLRILSSSLFQMAAVSSWRDTFTSREWHEVVKVFNWVATQADTSYAPNAVAASLWVLCINWSRPEQAVVTAAHLGGLTGVTASMAGALAGALHGHEWIPDRWLRELENGLHGRDYAVDLARKLAALDCRKV